MRKSLFVLVTSLLILVAAAAPATASPSPPGVAHAMGYYLALGDSLAAGYQPDQGDDKTGGYVGGTLAAITVTKPKTRLVNLACSGETVVTLTTGGRCSYELGSQLAQAVDFLEHHGRFTRVITLNIGSNDVQTCVNRTTLAIDMVCIENGFAAIASGLPSVLATLRDPRTERQDRRPQLLQPVSRRLPDRPDRTGACSAVGRPSGHPQRHHRRRRGSRKGARLADVATAFQSTDWTPVTGAGSVPTNVAVICSLTWMCPSQGGSPDIHPNDDGYAVIAATVVTRL